VLLLVVAIGGGVVVVVGVEGWFVAAGALGVVVIFDWAKWAKRAAP